MSTTSPSKAPSEAAKPLARGETWRGLVERLSERMSKRKAASRRLLAQLVPAAERLLSESGDTEGQRLAGELAEGLGGLDDAELREFFIVLANRFGPDEAGLKAAARAYLKEPSAQTAAALNLAAEPRRQELLRRLNMAPGGTALIVKLRERVLEMAQPDFVPVAADMRHLLASWFNRGFLKAEKLDWNSPAVVLENIIRFEAVHEISDWDSLRSRLQGNRRCFGFFHPAMPGVPLIFIEVALTREMSPAIAPLLASAELEAPLKAPTNAVFYSINNCHAGLKGISLGDLLIKQVVLDLRTEFPSLKDFATLSPIPGFRKWLTRAERSPGLVPPAVSEALATEEWWRKPGLAEQVRQPLLVLCAEYLTGRTPEGGKGRVSDPVARFHLTNGARLERINWLADTSPKGIAESCGLMVNYRYLLNAIEANHHAFVSTDHVITSAAVKKMRDSGLPGSQRLARSTFLPTLKRAAGLARADGGGRQNSQGKR